MKNAESTHVADRLASQAFLPPVDPIEIEALRSHVKRFGIGCLRKVQKDFWIATHPANIYTLLNTKTKKTFYKVKTPLGFEFELPVEDVVEFRKEEEVDGLVVKSSGGT